MPESSVPLTSPASEMETGLVTPVRIVTYNMRGSRGIGMRGSREVAAVGALLRELDADVVCLQEAPRRLAWRDRCAALARRSHLLYTAGGGTTGGTAMLTAARIDVRDVRESRLQPTPGLRKRGAVLAVLSKGGIGFCVLAMHLGLDAAERARHVTEITGIVHRAAAPGGVLAGITGTSREPVAVIAGDVNETPHGSTWSRLATQYADAGAGDPTPTRYSNGRANRMDGVFVRGPAELVSYRVADPPRGAGAHGHRPVVVDLLLPG
ncbi:hypothetical protein EF847_14130 [Actinobacteria bacterium YIM 96077]|uniref:Endonuclease/exonuclease/phosphatase domain-containing protein n=1 Tax=Phytoactinopolyspora halophila TaxID=1981511 RepID=A0A329QG84_9ACTN|nr:endonuclease/exonuclease/phosphatase family protein [Phytoactinopolyspora halophila]AYY13662.1 hypothetical protein EF847_14130 [Actinobacteria bacterium YIM 96077]RAW11226.1 hypothetical protein DPM12_17040 [Phytoactinopolyspora halophila]